MILVKFLALLETAHKTLGERQTTLGKKNYGKGRFAECHLSGTRQRLR
jgi:hypothetical protein